MGRPSEFSQDKADRICALIAEGQSLRSICQADGMPSKSTVCLWLQKQPGFSDQYARARETQTEHWAEEILEIADDSSGDSYEDSDGNERTNHEVVARSRLRVDSRKWLMSKLAPKKYGDRLDLNHAGKDGGPLVVEVVQFVNAKDKDTA